MVDPWAGSYYVESLTHELMHKAWHHIQEIEALGGMAKAIETGIPKMRIEEAAARRQAQIDSGRETIVGVNKYRLAEEEPLDVREVDNRAVRDSQLHRLAEIRRTRDAARRGGGARRPDPRRRNRLPATCWNWPSTPPASAPRWARSPRRSKRSSAATRR